MKIAILGTGVVGQTIAEKLATLRHEVMMGTRDPKETNARKEPGSFGRPSFSDWIKNNSSIKVATFSEAAAFGEMIVNATSGHGALPALEAAGKANMNGKVVLDISNPLDFSKGMPPTLFVCNTDSLGEQIQRDFPDSRVVKGLNTMSAAVMVNPGMLKGGSNVFISGNDAEAKESVKSLLVSFGWHDDDVVDVGDITTARGTEQILPLWIRLMGALQTPMFNFNIVR